MAFSLTYKLFFLLSSIPCFFFGRTAAATHGLSPPTNLPRLTDMFPHLPFNQSFSDCFGGPNIQHVNNGSCINLILNKSSGSGFKSVDMYHYGFFSAAIKLPPSYSAGIVVAFYMSNSEMYPKRHDELDIELLGHEKRKEWMLQTNVYGNGSVGTGREEKFRLWFDPTGDFHHYSFLWNSHHIVFSVDNIPVREIKQSEAMAGAYPSKPMSIYGTIWDGSDWATHGGKKPVNYAFAPFVASFKDMQAQGCVSTTATTLACSKDANGDQRHPAVDPVGSGEFVKLSEQQKLGMEWVRDTFMVYSYCDDRRRWSVLPPECEEKKI